MVGNKGVGKSSLIMRFAADQFTNDLQTDHMTKSVVVDGQTLDFIVFDSTASPGKIEIKDTSKEETRAIIVNYDITDRQSQQDVHKWFLEISKQYDQHNSSLIKLLVGNKKDMDAKRQVAEVEGMDIASQFNAMFLETSSKSGQNVNEAFTMVAQQLLKVIIKENMQKNQHERQRDKSGEGSHRRSSGLSRTNERAYEHSTNF